MRLLDLFCGAGGCSVGYRRAGFAEIVGVDLHPQPNYPFEFVRADALEYLREHGREFDAVHASPPCQRYTVGRHIHGSGDRHPDLVGPCREGLDEVGVPWVMENVPGSPLNGAMLCGTMFGLSVRRHRVFDASFMLFSPGCPCRHRVTDYGVYAGRVTRLGTRGVAYTASSGRTHYRPESAEKEHAAEAMGIDWMTLKELCQAIPPAYTEFVGRQLLDHVRSRQEG